MGKTIGSLLKQKIKQELWYGEIFLTGLNNSAESSYHLYAYVAAYAYTLLFGTLISMVSLAC